MELLVWTVLAVIAPAWTLAGPRPGMPEWFVAVPLVLSTVVFARSVVALCARSTAGRRGVWLIPLLVSGLHLFGCIGFSMMLPEKLVLRD